jgi:hypothetical protein
MFEGREDGRGLAAALLARRGAVFVAAMLGAAILIAPSAFAEPPTANLLNWREPCYNNYN